MALFFRVWAAQGKGFNTSYPLQLYFLIYKVYGIDVIVYVLCFQDFHARSVGSVPTELTRHFFFPAIMQYLTIC
jgi:hypothetical protein